MPFPLCCVHARMLTVGHPVLFHSGQGSLPLPANPKQAPCARRFLVNGDHLALGTRQDGRAVGDVELPPWPANPKQAPCARRFLVNGDHLALGTRQDAPPCLSRHPARAGSW